MNSFVKEITGLETQLEEGRHPGVYAHLLEHTAGMSSILREINRAAASDMPVLITGESGTGKEWVARTIHARSSRMRHPFIKALCIPLPHGLLDSELFGCEKGAFAGADRRKFGKFDFANRGSLFLDQVVAIPFSLETKLLQALRDGVFSRKGGKADVKVNVRMIAATPKTSLNEGEKESFMEPLLYSLNAMNITLPPLRERLEEIPFLVNFFLEKFNRRYNKRYAKLSSNLMKQLMTFDWPGNIRQLENVIKQIVVLGGETTAWEFLTSYSTERLKKSG